MVALCSVVPIAFYPLLPSTIFYGVFSRVCAGISTGFFPGYFSDVVAGFLLNFPERFSNYFAQNIYRNYPWNFRFSQALPRVYEISCCNRPVISLRDFPG